MGYPTEIRIHVDEEMREHIAFCLRRYRFELEQWNVRKKGADNDIIRELVLTSKCLKEVEEAGT